MKTSKISLFPETIEKLQNDEMVFIKGGVTTVVVNAYQCATNNCAKKPAQK